MVLESSIQGVQCLAHVQICVYLLANSSNAFTNNETKNHTSHVIKFWPINDKMHV